MRQNEESHIERWCHTHNFHKFTEKNAIELLPLKK